MIHKYTTTLKSAINSPTNQFIYFNNVELALPISIVTPKVRITIILDWLVVGCDKFSLFFQFQGMQTVLVNGICYWHFWFDIFWGNVTRSMHVRYVPDILADVPACTTFIYIYIYMNVPMYLLALHDFQPSLTTPIF